jgi:hypothetical protein
MIPEYIVVRPSFALNHNGKVDVNSLPQPVEDDRWKGNVEFTPPHTPLEAELCEIFSDILGVKLGTTHNFFESGGTSMTAISCLLRIKQKCHVSISVSEFYVNPSVVQLAALVHNSNSNAVARYVTIPLPFSLSLY